MYITQLQLYNVHNTINVVQCTLHNEPRTLHNIHSMYNLCNGILYTLAFTNKTRNNISSTREKSFLKFRLSSKSSQNSRKKKNSLQWGLRGGAIK